MPSLLPPAPNPWQGSHTRNRCSAGSCRSKWLTLQSVNSYGVLQLNTDGRTALQLYNIERADHCRAGKRNINILQRQLLTRSWKSGISLSTSPRGKAVNIIFNLRAAFKVSNYWTGNSLFKRASERSSLMAWVWPLEATGWKENQLPQVVFWHTETWT